MVPVINHKLLGIFLFLLVFTTYCISLYYAFSLAGMTRDEIIEWTLWFSYG